MKPIALSLLVAMVAIGCSHPEDDSVADGTPPPQKFEGTIDKRLVGAWKSPDGSQTMTINEDGKAKMEGYVNTPKGKQPINEAMEWKADASKLSFKMSSGTVQKYAFTLEDDSLILKTAKTSTTYKKAK